MCAGELHCRPPKLTADIVERFQLGLMLLVIAMRNVIEMAGSDLAFLPKSFTRGKSLLERILSVSTMANEADPSLFSSSSRPRWSSTG